MKDHSGCKRGFHRFSKAWYRDDILDKSINIGMYHTDSSTSGEFSIQWIDLGLTNKSPRLQVFNDAWHVLSLFKDLLEALAEIDDQNTSEEEITKLLISLKIEDLTEYEQPKK